MVHFSIQAMFALYKKLKQNKTHSDYSQINRIIIRKNKALQNIKQYSNYD